jgi:hypothetical protein
MQIFGRIVRRLVIRTGRGVYRRRGIIAIGAVLIAVVVVVSGLNLMPLDFSLPSAPSGPSRSSEGAYAGTSDGEPQATVSFIRGQQVYDARMVWDAYSDRMHRTYQQRGGSVDDIQRQLDASRQRGTRIEQAQYIGSYAIPNGKMAFYVVMQSSGGRGSVSYVPYTFTLDAAGKIDRVE